MSERSTVRIAVPGTPDFVEVPLADVVRAIQGRHMGGKVLAHWAFPLVPGATGAGHEQVHLVVTTAPVEKVQAVREAVRALLGGT